MRSKLATFGLRRRLIIRSDRYRFRDTDKPARASSEGNVGPGATQFNMKSNSTGASPDLVHKVLGQ
jgi:hypothetical protein